MAAYLATSKSLRIPGDGWRWGRLLLPCLRVLNGPCFQEAAARWWPATLPACLIVLTNVKNGRSTKLMLQFCVCWLVFKDHMPPKVNPAHTYPAKPSDFAG